MANWKKKEAGYMVVSNKANAAQFFCEKFHNVNEMKELEQKYQWINANIEYHIGTFANNAEIEDAMNSVVRESFFVEPGEYDPKRIINGSFAYLTEEMFMKKWNEVKAQGRLYTNEEAQELGLKEWWGYHEAQLPEGRRKMDMLVLQDRLISDSDKDFFYACAQKHILMHYYELEGK